MFFGKNWNQLFLIIFCFSLHGCAFDREQNCKDKFCEVEHMKQKLGGKNATCVNRSVSRRNETYLDSVIRNYKGNMVLVEYKVESVGYWACAFAHNRQNFTENWGEWISSFKLSFAGYWYGFERTGFMSFWYKAKIRNFIYLSPLCILGTVFNVAILRKVASESEFAASIFHFAEIWVDFCSCVLQILAFINFTIVFDLVRLRFYIQFPLEYALPLLNQLLLLALVYDRFFALHQPLEYRVKSTKKRGKILVVGFVISTFLFGVLYKNYSYFFGIRFFKMYAPMLYLGSYICTWGGQIVFSVLLFRLYRAHVHETEELTGRQAEEHKVREEIRKKIGLLVGTVGLNIVCGLPSVLVWSCRVAGQIARDYKSLGWARFFGEWLWNALGAEVLAGGFNSSLGVFLHFFTTQTYRNAVKDVVKGWVQSVKNFKNRVHPIN